MCIRIRWYRLCSITPLSVYAVLLSFCVFALAAAPGNDYRLDALHADPSGSVSAVIQIPDDQTAEPYSFHLLEDGVPTIPSLKVTPFSDSRWRLSLIVCVDTSGSMKGSPTDEVKDALKKLLASSDFRSIDEVALRTFDDSTRRIWWFDTTQSRITEAIDALRARGQWTVLYNAMYAALEDFTSRLTKPRNIRRILVISDGKNDVDRYASDQGTPNRSLAEVRALAQSLAIPIDFLARVRQDHVQADLAEGNVQAARAVSDETGGHFEYAEPGQVYIKLKAILDRTMAKPVVSFQRKIDPSAGVTKMAGVMHADWLHEFPKAIGRTLVEPLPSKEKPEVPTVTPEPPPKFRVPTWLLWLSTVTVILLFAFVTYYLRNKRARIAKSESLKSAEPLSPEPIPSTSNERITASSPSPQTSDIPSDSKSQAATISLNCVNGPAAGNHYSFELNHIQIGSDETLDNDLCVHEDEHVSAEHASIDFTEGRLYVTDLNATNGTLLNGARLDPGKATLIHSGDQLQVGMSIFEVYTSAVETNAVAQNNQ